MRSLRKNERGMVSILVTMIMIIVISLIVLGFAQITRSNQREALDNQLSAQAYYAAESGVNAAVNYLSLNPNYSVDTVTAENCQQFITTLGGGTINILDKPTSTQYTCLMVDTQPPNLVLSPLTQTGSTVLHLANADKEPFTALNFKWQEQTNPAKGGCTSSGANGDTLPEYDKWKCPFGILRLDLVDTNYLKTANLQNNMYAASFYLVPSYHSGGSFSKVHAVQWPPAPQSSDPTAAPAAACNSGADNCTAQIVPVSCTKNNNCSLELKFTKGGTGTDLYARMTMMYQDTSQLEITGGDTTNPLNLKTNRGANFSTGQALIDSTGQSEDEIRRVQVRIPLQMPSGDIPNYAMQATDGICKQLTVGPNVTPTDTCPGHP